MRPFDQEGENGKQELSLLGTYEGLTVPWDRRGVLPGRVDFKRLGKNKF